MFRKALIAFSAITLLATGLASTAEAKTKLHIQIGHHGYHGGYWGGHWGGGYWDGGYYGGDCYFVWKSYKKWNKHHTRFFFVKKKVLICD